MTGVFQDFGRQARRQMVNIPGLSRDGARWLEAAIDPFHDTELSMAGYPDQDCANTVVARVRQQVQISAPAAAEWDLHVCNLPYTGSNKFAYACDCLDGVAKSSSGTTQATVIGAVPCVSCDSGDATWPDESYATWAPGNFAYQCMGPETYSDAYRIIAWGIEVHNTTAEVYKQGTVCVYKMPQVVESEAGTLDDVGVLTEHSYLRTFMQPPSTISEAISIPGSRVWEAADGAYIVPTLMSSNNDLTNSVYASPMMQRSDHSAAGLTTFGVVGVLPATTKMQTCHFSHWNTVGAFFSGLSKESTLTVTTIMYIERAPTYSNTGLIPLVSPSAAYDSLAMESYSNIMRLAPPGVPVGMNAKGDWWRLVMSLVPKALPLLAKALPPTYQLPAAAALAAAQPLVNLVGKNLSARAKKRRAARARKRVNK